MILDTTKNQLAADSALPNYDTAVGIHPKRHVPQAPIKYDFTGWAQSSMFLMPPRGFPIQQPLYRITVELDLNPFLPVSHVTKVFRCGDQENELVAEFSFALNHKRAVLSMGDTVTRLSNALFSVNSTPKHFNWILGHRLHWDCREMLGNGSPLCVCYLPPSSTAGQYEGVKIASFIPPPPDASPPLPDATITIFPQGHQLMDHIIVSALVVERMLTR
ncbi:hypothetical protein M413DRAFT_444279 [Hebeloma cylindrosporum]|uniref:DUF6593 domain-containing protein n=1 Tax=Hebeloma cylindrosporum TaxID=76867 RepID=A0A0C3CEC5_HEBCY|nr:hypothetical protein M413DRAFT_444279 [Hebeloma cylindrosporum h7]